MCAGVGAGGRGCGVVGTQGGKSAAKPLKRVRERCAGRDQKGSGGVVLI